MPRSRSLPRPEGTARPGDGSGLGFPPSSGRRRKSGGRLRRWASRLLRAAIVIIVLLGGALAVSWQLTPSVTGAPGLVAARLARFGDQPLTALPTPDRVGQALVATENSRFYSEPGVDPIGIARALLSPLRGGGDPGGATLDQQLAKVLYTPEANSPPAVAEQLVLAVKLDAHFSKSEILRLYESAVYFGHGYYGLPAAAHGYFGVAPSALSWAQASLLAGLVQAPSAYDPLVHLSLARARQQVVLDRLVATHVLTTAQAGAAYRAPLGLR